MNDPEDTGVFGFLRNLAGDTGYSRVVREYHTAADAPAPDLIAWAKTHAAPLPPPAVVTDAMKTPPAVLSQIEQDRLYAVAVRNRDDVAAQLAIPQPTERLMFARFLYMRGRINEFMTGGHDPLQGSAG